MLTGSLAALAACATKKPKIAGVQIPVLPPSNALAVAVDAPPVAVPAPVGLAGWPQVLASPAHAPGNIAGPSGLKPAWRANIGAPGGYRQPLPAAPLAANGSIFTMDANAAVSALGAGGARSWRTGTRPKHVSAQNLGGGIGYDNGMVYAATGYGELVALDAGSGKIVWRQKLDFPARSAPTIAGGIVAVVTQNDLLLTFDQASGTPGWRFTGKVTDSTASSAVLGAPAYSDGLVVAGFSSGTLAALDVNSGTPLWEQSLASSYSVAGPLAFSDIVAPPVIVNDVVYAISLGNSAMAVDLHSGAQVWEHDVTGNQAIYLAGDFAYVLDIHQNLAAIHADDGLVSWMVQLPAYRHPKSKSGPRNWNGPVMVNGQLLFTDSLGEMMSVDPVTGALGAVSRLAGPADLTPVVSGGEMLILTRDAVLTAYS
jgi:outer membrane protein assembly factor BamB